MPVYRFHLEGEDPALDATQVTLSDDDAARHAAIVLVGGMMRDGDVDLLPDGCFRMTVSTAEDRLVASLDVSLSLVSGASVSK